MSADKVTNIVIAGLGGQGVLTASDILAEAAFLAGRDVKKAEVHGMSQRGGSVSTDVRIAPAGGTVHSPMVSAGVADFLLVLEATQIDVNRHMLAAGGKLIGPSAIDESKLANRRSFNVAMLGALSVCLDLPTHAWEEAIKTHLPAKLHPANLQAFEVGRTNEQLTTDS